MKNWKIILISFVVPFYSCADKTTQLKDVEFWKYSDGYHIGDVLDFNHNSYRMENDTIFENNIPTAKFIRIDNRFGFADDKLIIKDLNSDTKGYYSGK